MKDSKASIKSQAVFSDDGAHRVFLRREWDKNKPSALVLMINPSTSSLIHTDITTLCILNNLETLDYGSVEIVNMYSRVTTKLSFRLTPDEELLHPDTNKYILKAAENCQTVIVAWGTIGESNSRAKARQYDILKVLQPYSHKLQCISDTEGKICIHPLCPSVRNEWNLVPFPYDEWMISYDSDQKSDKKDKSATSKKSSKKNTVKVQDNDAVATSDTVSEALSSDTAVSTENIINVVGDMPDTSAENGQQETVPDVKVAG